MIGKGDVELATVQSGIGRHGLCRSEQGKGRAAAHSRIRTLLAEREDGATPLLAQRCSEPPFIEIHNLANPVAQFSVASAALQLQRGAQILRSNGATIHKQKADRKAVRLSRFLSET